MRNTSYRNRINAYRRDAEVNFHGHNGANNNGLAEQGFDQQDPFNNYNGQGGGFEVLDPNDRTLTVTVANTNTTPQTAVIFGSNRDLTDALLPSGVTVTVAESSHQQVKSEIFSNPIRITGLKYVVNTVAQFSNTLSLINAKSTGGQTTRVWQPLNYRSAQQDLTTQIDAMQFSLLVDSSTYISWTLNGSETVTFTFTISERAELKNVLRGKSVRKVATVSAPTGLPQLDMASIRGNMRKF